MEKQLHTSLRNTERIVKIAHTLSNPIRIEILKLLAYEALSVKEIAKKMNLPLTTVSSNIKVLEEASLINCIYQAGKHGSMKLCSIMYESLTINLLEPISEDIHSVRTYEIPLGSYFSIDIVPTCGMATEFEFIGKDDDVLTFYSEKRFNAQLLWFFQGFVEYRIPVERNRKVIGVELTMELCSEAPNYRTEWPSDITLLMNDIEIGTFTCPGDFGGRRGKFTPSWWPINSTQFGVLKTWTVNEKASLLDYKYLSSVTIGEVMHDHNAPYISIKVGIKKDAKNIGGINIFGERFGDYQTGIVVKVIYDDSF